ncbi:transmembrane protein 186 [Atheta coriaria]|uniref:transmembrane protein 186 n=1 Tax=Dalotia coriaria TaxID=877792 RepID=UPI0031F372EB
MLTCKLSPQLFKLNLLQIVRRQVKSTYGQKSPTEYIPVYSFPYIQSLAFIHKAKVYQTAATFIGIPASFALSVANVFSTQVCSSITVCGITGCMLLHTLGYLTSNTIGIVYLHKDETKSKVSYLDAWGSRRDVIIDLKNIVPFSDQPTRFTDPLYLRFQQYNSKDKYKMNVKYGIVLDPKKFQVIFHKNSD